MIQKKLIVKGKLVQAVNCRELICAIARQMSVQGKVKNLDDGTVKILCQCKDDEHLNKFIVEIKKLKKESGPFVEDVISYPLEDNTLEYFIVDYGNVDLQNEMLFKLSLGSQYIQETREELNYLKDRYGMFGRTLLIIALETVKNKKHKMMLEDILEKEVEEEKKKP